MLRIRVIPALLVDDGRLVKTVRFRNPAYIGDPINTARIFNELEVDELLILDICATRLGRPPNFVLLKELAEECFMPLAYGGGIKSVDDIGSILSSGLEKVVINSFALDDPSIIQRAAKRFGSQAIIGSIDVRKHFWKGYRVHAVGGTKDTGLDPVQWARELERLGVGEILLTSIDQEGTWSGYDVGLVRAVTDAVSVPVIAHGGAGAIPHLLDAVAIGGASALALGSMVVYQQKGLGVLINFPDKAELARHLENR